MASYNGKSGITLGKYSERDYNTVMYNTLTYNKAAINNKSRYTTISNNIIQNNYYGIV